MKKTTRQRMMNQDPTRQRRLKLSQETVRTLDHDQLSRAVGGSCDTTSNPTDKRQLTSRH
jgi:hypothetical protein